MVDGDVDGVGDGGGVRSIAGSGGDGGIVRPSGGNGGGGGRGRTESIRKTRAENRLREVAVSVLKGVSMSVR